MHIWPACEQTTLFRGRLRPTKPRLPSFLNFSYGVIIKPARPRSFSFLRSSLPFFVISLSFFLEKSLCGRKVIIQASLQDSKNAKSEDGWRVEAGGKWGGGVRCRGVLSSHFPPDLSLVPAISLCLLLDVTLYPSRFSLPPPPPTPSKSVLSRFS